MLTPFTLKAGDEWAHIVNFLNFFTRDDEREFRHISNNLRADIMAKREQLADKNQMVVAKDKHITPVVTVFQQHFVWQHGEYNVTLEVTADPKRANVRKQYRITLFESDTQQLQDHVNGYKYGAGVIYVSDAQESVVTPLNQT